MSDYLDPNPFNRNWNNPSSTTPAPTPPPQSYADITIILDRSSSMGSMKEAVIDGFNEYVGKMRETPGDTRWTMIQFDDRDSARGAGESFPHVVFENKGEREVPLLNNESYRPRGNTALVDAVCSSIYKTKVRTSGMEESTKVVMMVITDGQENSSKEFSSVNLREMVAETQAKHDWTWLYLGANQDSFIEAGKYNMGGSMTWLNKSIGGSLVSPDATAVNNFVPTAEGMRQAIASGMYGSCSVVSGCITSGQVGFFHSPQYKGCDGSGMFNSVPTTF